MANNEEDDYEFIIETVEEDKFETPDSSFENVKDQTVYYTPHSVFTEKNPSTISNNNKNSAISNNKFKTIDQKRQIKRTLQLNCGLEETDSESEGDEKKDKNSPGPSNMRPYKKLRKSENTFEESNTIQSADEENWFSDEEIWSKNSSQQQQQQQQRNGKTHLNSLHNEEGRTYEDELFDTSWIVLDEGCLPVELDMNASEKSLE